MFLLPSIPSCEYTTNQAFSTYSINFRLLIKELRCKGHITYV